MTTLRINTRETNSVNKKRQNRIIGKRAEKNFAGHASNTIGAKIDYMIKNDNFTKKQIQTFAGTKMSKVNSHIHHLRKDKNFTVIIDKTTKIVSFG